MFTQKQGVDAFFKVGITYAKTAIMPICYILYIKHIYNSRYVILLTKI